LFADRRIFAFEKELNKVEKEERKKGRVALTQTGEDLVGPDGGCTDGVEVDLLELLLGEVGKLVQGEAAAVLAVEVADESHVGLEVLKALCMLQRRIIHLVVLDGPVDEALVELSVGDSRC